MSKNTLSQNGLRAQTCGFIASAAAFYGVLMAAIVSLILISAEVSAASEPKRILLIGATAKAAPQLINQALEAGHEVIGLARRPEAVEIKHERFTVVKGDVYDLGSLEDALTGDEVVISYLDIPFTTGIEITEEVYLLSRGTKNIIQAMYNKGNRRFIAVSTRGVETVIVDKPSADAPITDHISWDRRRKYDDHRRMDELVKASGLDWIILRPTNLMEAPMRGTVNTVVNRHMYIAVNGKMPPRGRTLTNADFAAFILDQLDSDEYLGKIVGLYN